MIIEQIKLKGKTLMGIIIEMPHAPLILIKSDKGYVMCGYLNITVANNLGDVAARVTGVKSFEDVLNAKVVEMSDKAKELGLSDGIKAVDFLERIIDAK